MFSFLIFSRVCFSLTFENDFAFKFLFHRSFFVSLSVFLLSFSVSSAFDFIHIWVFITPFHFPFFCFVCRNAIT